MDRMVHVALNSLQNLRLDQRINAQNLANMNVAGFRKDLPASRSSTFLGNMEQFETRYFVTASDKMEFSSAEGLVRRTEGKLDFALRGPGYFSSSPSQICRRHCRAGVIFRSQIRVNWLMALAISCWTTIKTG